MKCFAVKFSEMSGPLNPGQRWDVPFDRLIAALNGRVTIDEDFLTYLLGLLSNDPSVARLRLKEIVEDSTSATHAVDTFRLYVKLGNPLPSGMVTDRPFAPLKPEQEERLLRLLKHAAAFRIHDLACIEQSAKVTKNKLAKKFSLCPKKLRLPKKFSGSPASRTAPAPASMPTPPS